MNSERGGKEKVTQEELRYKSRSVRLRK